MPRKHPITAGEALSHTMSQAKVAALLRSVMAEVAISARGELPSAGAGVKKRSVMKE